ncbi:MAG: hypothetical protein ACYC0T_14760 [Ramlibacter sp.]
MKQLLVPLTIALACGFAGAKLPPPDDAAKAKAAETAAKAAWQAKVDAYQLCKAQDRVAALYKASAAGTPVAATPPPPCQDPGPFAYNPPEQKPLETSGAHSPSGTAASPPSVLPHSGQMPPAAPKKP